MKSAVLSIPFDVVHEIQFGARAINLPCYHYLTWNIPTECDFKQMRSQNNPKSSESAWAFSNYNRGSFRGVRVIIEIGKGSYILIVAPEEDLSEGSNSDLNGENNKTWCIEPVSIQSGFSFYSKPPYFADSYESAMAFVKIEIEKALLEARQSVESLKRLKLELEIPKEID